MILPIHKTYDDYRKTTWLYFDEGDPRESYIRGGICFPVHYRTSQGIVNNGYAVIGGKDLITGIVWIYGQMSFVTVDDILATEGDPDYPVNAVKYPGLSHWLNKMWGDYFSQTFYYNQPEELSRRFILQIKRSFMIKPKPRIVEVPITNERDFLSSVWHWSKTEKIKIDKDSQLVKDMASMQEDDKNILPSVYALGCLLMGVERYPWRKPYEAPIQEVFIAS